VQIRDAKQSELAEIGAIRVTAFRTDGFLPAGSGYEPTLRDLGADGGGHVLVAVGDDGALLGTVMLQGGPEGGPIVTGPDVAEVRALAVRPQARGAGLGRALLSAVIDLAVREHVLHLVLYTQPGMKAARRLYEAAGFVRRPEQDWSPQPDVDLLAYGLMLGSAARTPSSARVG
jgi:GNAT superfamily N-acetyltransferase